MEQIKDGTGSGNLVKVDENNALLTRAVTSTEEHFVSFKKEGSYFANMTDTANTLTATATGGGILYIENTSSTKKLIIEKVLTSADTAGGVVVWKKNVTVGSIGNNNTHSPVNLNFGSSITADVTCYNWNETGDGMTGITGGTTIKTFITNTGFTVHPIDGVIILDKSNNFLLEYSVAGGGEFECGVRFYFDTV